tara:strand:- start:112 stop:354 length:243 start_codon:yes stop_codon:yes gene_type:complete
MIGGGIKLQKIFNKSNSSDIIGIFLITLVLFFLRAYIVQVTYNLMWPKIVSNAGGDPSQFTPITFYESLMIVFLFSFLFR